MDHKQYGKDYLLDLQLREHSDRLEALENKIKPSKKEKTNRGQQILLLYHLGLLDKIKELNLSNIQQARLLSVLLNADQENLRHDLSVIYNKDSELKHELNYNFLFEIFGELKLKKLQLESQKILKGIQDLKDQK